MEMWQLARKLNIDILPILEKLEKERYYGLKNQLDNSAGSAMDNIAEGFERDGNREFIQFLAISKGSLGEMRSQLHRAKDRQCIEDTEYEKLLKDSEILGNQIAGFISYLNRSGIKGGKFKNRDNPTPSEIRDQK
jgi:four helix bundle protein